jgi:beta-1,4-N-acetylglucosaminyltransferase
MIVLGSGGHTTEMLHIVRNLDFERYSPRYYVLANSDQTSVVKLTELEIEKERDPEKHNFEVATIYRSREVHQSYISSVFTTVRSILSSFPIVYKAKPDLILCNGPGTCVPICIVAFLYKLLWINSSCKIAFVESFCRVKSLSLSGKIIRWIADLFVVQWPDIKANSAQYFGRLS